MRTLGIVVLCLTWSLIGAEEKPAKPVPANGSNFRIEDQKLVLNREASVPAETTMRYVTEERKNGLGKINDPEELLRMELKEIEGAKRHFQCIDDKSFGLTIRIGLPEYEVLLVQMLSGATTLLFVKGGKTTSISAPSFTELLKRFPDKIQPSLLRPMADLGFEMAPHKFLPPVMAVATGAYNPSSKEIVAQADALIAKLSAENMDERELATKELIGLFPRAIFHISEAAKAAKDPEVKTRLESVIAAHPGIARAREFVEKEKLHENRVYLLDLLANVPFFKSPARARLAVLFGKDYGDDLANWPKE
jgi:hypothetical protein